MSDRASTAFDTRSLSALRSVGGILPPDLIASVVTGTDLPGLDADDYHLELGVTPREAANRAWAVLTGAWAAYRQAMAARPADDPAVGLTRDKWLSVLLRELGFGRVPVTPAGGIVADDRSWPVSHLAEGNLPVHLLGWDVNLDRRTPGMAGAAERAPQAMIQELLNRSDEYLWALLANGSTLRVLRDSTTLIGPSYVEFDLATIFEGELFSDFVVLYLICHQSRFEPLDPDLGLASCWLERWRAHAVEAGTRALGALRVGVHDAIEALGSGLLSHPANTELRSALDEGRLGLADFHHGLLRLVYRLLFCFVAEDRGLLLDPEADSVAKGRYDRWFSTGRLRRIAVRRRGDRHSDLWHGLRLVLGSLGKEEGCPALGLVGLGGIFDQGPADLDQGLELDNRAVLSTFRHLCVTRPVPTGPRRVVDYRHLGAEELGGIYEGLLEYVPRHDPVTRTFTLESFVGNERKRTGAYYTPSSLTECLLDATLDPLLDRAEGERDPRAGLLSVTVCDPACGSGHFLVAAGRRIAARLARIRADGAEPSLADLQRAMHDVVSRCLYGVDINPLAAELAKVSLWLEGLQAGEPLTFLDSHIKVGNALLGTSPALLSAGIPDEAFTPIEGDDKKVAAALKRRNQAERVGQGRLDDVGGFTVGTTELAEGTNAIEGLMRRTLSDIHVAERRLRELDGSPEARRARLIADAWCAAFVLPKVQTTPELTQATLVAIERDKAPAALVEAVGALTARYRFFHWHIEFPTIFDVRVPAGLGNPATGSVGGFSCVIGNPPWERVKLQEQEWFAARLPAVAEAPSAASRKRLISLLAGEHPALHREFLAARRQSEAESHFIRNSGRYPLSGRGDINTYAAFAESDRSLLGPTGRLGVILPAGIATDSTTQYFFKDLVTERALVSLLHFENEALVFAGVHHAFKFCLLTVSGREASVHAASFAFFARHVEDLSRDGARYSLSPEEITLINPNTGTCPVFRNRRDAEITLGIYRRHPILIRRDDPEVNPWGVSFMTMFHMSNDSGLFHIRTELEEQGWKLDGNVFGRGGEIMLPLYESKLVHYYDHRWATYTDDGDVRDVSDSEHGDPHFTVLPRYWVAKDQVSAHLAGRWSHHWLLGFRDITNTANERTLITGQLPLAAVGNNLPILLPSVGPTGCLAAALSSLVLDFVARLKVGGTHMNFFLLEQLPVPSPSVFADPCPWSLAFPLNEWIAKRTVELSYTAWDIEAAARALGDTGPPFSWNPERRAALRAELDGAFFHLYGIDRDDVEYILSTFPIAVRRDPDLPKRVLDTYDRIAAAIETGSQFMSTLDPPPGDGRKHQERA